MRIDPTHEAMVREAIDRVSIAWARSVPIPIQLRLDSLELIERDSFLRSLGRSVCVGRSPFVAEGKGVGGWILPEGAADRLSRGLLSLPPPPPHAVASFGGPVDEGTQIIHSLFIEAWNQGIPAAWRLNDDIQVQCAERLADLGTRAVKAPIYPWVLPLDFEIAGHFYQLGIVVSPSLVDTPDPQFAPSPAVPSWQSSQQAPVAFVDPTGTVTKWLLEEIRAGRLVCKRGPVAASGPRATVTIGGSPDVEPGEVLTICPAPQ